MVGDEEVVVLVVVGEVEVEAAVDEVVDEFISHDVHALYFALHQQFFVDHQERQEQIFVAVVRPLEVHVVVELVLEDAAADPRNGNQVPGHPLVLAHPGFEVVVVTADFIEGFVLLLKFLKEVEADMHTVVVDIGG
jgi:hypothetical protein